MEEKYWKRFESSGKVEDYLSFVSNVKREQAGKSGYAGTYMGNGNHTEAESGGRIRQVYQSFD